MNIRKKRLLIEMLDECFNSISDRDDHHGDWRNLGEDEETALQGACCDVFYSLYAVNEMDHDFIAEVALEILLKGYEECAA